MTLRNRIIGYAEVDPADLLANPRNMRIHPTAQQEALAGSLEEVGWVRDILVNRASGFVIDGHARVALALRRGERSVPVSFVDLTPKEEALVLASLDYITGMAAIDNEQLDALLREVSTGNAALQAMLSDMATEAGLYGLGQDDNGDVDAEPQISRAEELRAKWGTEAGQLWKLGAHRLAVGDCTDAAVVERVMGGERFQVMWTDPPYGVSYAAKNEMLNAVSRGNRIQVPIEGDHLNEVEVKALLLGAFGCAYAVGTAGAAAYVAAPAGPLHRVFIEALSESGFPYRHQLVWVKNQFVLGRADYNYKHEPILYGWKDDGAHYFGGAGGACTVFEVDKPRSNNLHPTMKPVELVAPMVQNSSRPGDVVFEPFSGSGTTLIACESLGRRCRAVEIDPGYAAVTLQRWADATGGTPELIGE